MKKLLFLMFLCAGMALTMAAGSSAASRVQHTGWSHKGHAVMSQLPANTVKSSSSLQRLMRERGLTPGDNPLAKKAPQRLSMDEMAGIRITSLKCRDFDQEFLLVGDPYYVGWESNMVETEDPEGGYLWLENAYCHFDMPIDVDLESQEATMYYGTFYQNEVSKQIGTFQFDTLTIACVMDWNEFLGGEVVDTNVGTVYNDGSVEFQGSFVYIISEVISEYDALSRHLISSDTAFIVSPVIHDMLMLVPNGTHEFERHIIDSSVSLDDFIISSTAIYQGWNCSGSWSTILGLGGVIGRPVDPRPIKPGTVKPKRIPNGTAPWLGQSKSWENHGEPDTLNSPVYMYQLNDSTVAVYNLFGRSMTENYMNIYPDGTMVFPCQVIDHGSSVESVTYNCTLVDGQLEPGNIGTITMDTIVWEATTTYESGSNAGSHTLYSNNRLYYNDGSAFMFEKCDPPVITAEVTDDAVIITAAADQNAIIIMTDDGQEVDNPYMVERGPLDQIVVVMASAQQEGMLPSDWVTLEVLVPARQFKVGDVNLDGKVTIKDVTTLLDMLLDGEAD